MGNIAQAEPSKPLLRVSYSRLAVVLVDAGVVAGAGAC